MTEVKTMRRIIIITTICGTILAGSVVVGSYVRDQTNG
jgi:hypothetical protein